MTNDWRNARIEEAERRYPDIEANPETFPTGWSREQERNAFIAGAVFEKALGEATVTPTDNEVNALACALFVADETDKLTVEECEPLASKVYELGFRRTEVPEPSTDRCQRCRWNAGIGAREPIGPHTCGIAKIQAEMSEASEPQGEPSPIPFYDDKMRELAEVRAQGEPSDATLGVMAQRFYEASGLNIPHTAKPEVVAGLRAAWEVR